MAGFIKNPDGSVTLSAQTWANILQFVDDERSWDEETFLYWVVEGGEMDKRRKEDEEDNG